MPSFTFAAAACLLASALQLASASAIPRLDSEIDTTAMLSARSTSTSGLSHPERIILYVVAGVASFLVIIGLIIGILRSRHYRAGENQARGITKANLKKIPIIQYDPQTTRKSSLDGSIDSDSDSISVLDEKCMENMSNHTCPICTGDFVQYQLLRVLPCGHQYHMKCIEDWLQRGSNCPICRVDLKPKTKQMATTTVTEKGLTPDLEQGQTQTRHVRSLHDRIVEDLYGLR